MPKELYDFACTLKHETNGAVLLNDGTKDAWFPKSVVELEPNGDGTYTATVPVQWAKDKELI